jgi:hypothetical protein
MNLEASAQQQQHGEAAAERMKLAQREIAMLQSMLNAKAAEVSACVRASERVSE